MKYVLKYICSFFVLAVFFTSCSEEFIFEKRTDLLTEKTWRIKTFVNYSQNETTEFRNADYLFVDDSTMMKIYENNDTIITSWQLSPDAEYLTIGTNIFRITELTSRVMSLRYGDVEIFFVPVK